MIVGEIKGRTHKAFHVRLPSPCSGRRTRGLLTLSRCACGALAETPISAHSNARAAYDMVSDFVHVRSRSRNGEPPVAVRLTARRACVLAEVPYSPLAANLLLVGLPVAVVVPAARRRPACCQRRLRRRSTRSANCDSAASAGPTASISSSMRCGSLSASAIRSRVVRRVRRVPDLMPRDRVLRELSAAGKFGSGPPGVLSQFPQA